MPRACRPVEPKNGPVTRSYCVCWRKRMFYCILLTQKKKISTWPEFPILKPKPLVFSNRNGIKLKPYIQPSWP